MLRPLWIAPWLAVACATVVHAQRSVTSDEDIETIVVVDSPPAHDVELTPGGATLIDGEALRERNVASFADLLRYVPGVWSASAHGGDTLFFSSRGSNLDATDYDMNGIVLLQDGLPVTAADGNNHNRVLDPLSARFATVARGANAVRYGASTLGGAIDVVSPTARNSAPLELYANRGSHGQLIARGTLGHVFDDDGADALLTLETKRWDGYRSHSEQRRSGVYANAGWQPSERVSTRLYASYLDNGQELPGALTLAELERDPSEASASALTGNFQIDVETLRVANRTTVRFGKGDLDFGLSLEEQSLYHPIVDVRVDFDGSGPELPAQVFSLLVDTEHLNAAAMLRYGRTVGRHELTFGLHYGRSAVDGGDYAHDAGVATRLMTSVDNRATMTTLYAFDRWQLTDRLLLELGAQAVEAERDVRNVDLGSGAVRAPSGDFSRVNPRAGVIYRASRGVDVFANLSSLYEPPTTYELEDEASGTGAVLDAMRGTVLELGTRGRRSFGQGKRFEWEVAAYYAEIENEILSVDDPAAPGTSLAANVDDTTHLGLEASFGAELPLGSNGAVLAPRLSLTINEFAFDGDRHYGDNELPAAPGHVLRGEILYRHASGFYFGPTFDIVDERFADFANTYRVDRYELLGLRAGWAGERFRVFAEAVNVTDERYVATIGVRDRAAADAEILNPGAPRAFYVGLQGRF